MNLTNIYTAWINNVRITNRYVSKEKINKLLQSYNITEADQVYIELNPTIDLFIVPFENLPSDLQDVIAKYSLSENDYEQCDNLVNELNDIGYTCEFGLDAVPYNLKQCNNIRRDKIRNLVEEMLTESFTAITKNLDVLLDEAGDLINNWDPEYNPMRLPKCIVRALLENELIPYQGKETSFKRELTKQTKQLKSYL